MALESALKPAEAWTVFARAERTENNELTSVGGHAGPIYSVGKISLGAIHDWQASDHTKIGLGGLVSVNQVPSALTAAYGRSPTGGMLFIRLKVD